MTEQEIILQGAEIAGLILLIGLALVYWAWSRNKDD